MIALLCLILFPSLVAAGLGGLAAQLRPSWSVRRTIVAAALPVPALLAAACLWFLADAVSGPKESCGLDACGMSMFASLSGLAYASFAFVVGALAVAWTKRGTIRR